MAGETEGDGRGGVVTPCVTGWLGSSYCVDYARRAGDTETDKTIVFVLLAALIILGVLVAARSFLRAYIVWRNGETAPEWVDIETEGDDDEPEPDR